MRRKVILLALFFLAIMGVTAAEIYNEQPVAKGIAVPRECFACEYDSIILDASGSYDIDGWIVEYNWYYNNNLIATGKRVSLGKDFTKNPGTYRIKLVVVDNGGVTDDYDLEFLVRSNPTPIIKSLKHPDEDFFVFGDKISVTAVLEKKNYGNLKYDWNYDPNVFKKIGDGDKVAFEVISSKAIRKNYKIELVVSNACGKKDSEEVEMEVRPFQPGSSLKVKIILPAKIEEGRSFQVKSSFVKEEGVDVSYLWKVYGALNKEEVLIKHSSKESPSFALPDSGTYAITLEITDRYQRKGSAAEIFEVGEMIDDPPVADASATLKTAVFGKVFTLNASKSRNPDGPLWNATNSYCWYDKSYEEDLGCSRRPVLNVVFNRSGPHDIVLTVKDSEFPKALSDTDLITINVIKSPGTAMSTQKQTAKPQPTEYPYREYKPAVSTPWPKAWTAIAIIILAIAFVRRKN